MKRKTRLLRNLLGIPMALVLASGGWAACGPPMDPEGLAIADAHGGVGDTYVGHADIWWYLRYTEMAFGAGDEDHYLRCDGDKAKGTFVVSAGTLSGTVECYWHPEVSPVLWSITGTVGSGGIVVATGQDDYLWDPLPLEGELSGDHLSVYGAANRVEASVGVNDMPATYYFSFTGKAQ